MPKMKTHKATSKRFRRTKGGKGKLMRTRGPQGHLRRKKRKQRKRLFYQMEAVGSKGMQKRVRRLMPNSAKLAANKTNAGSSTSQPAEKE